jgi:hypothetical protein
MQTLSPALIAEYLICLIVGLIGIAVLWQIYDGTIDLSRLISEPNGAASMSRFQFLVFTFVIALSLFLVIAAGKNGDGKPSFPETIPGGILTLLGISGSSYAVGKAIQFSDPAGVEDRPVAVTITPATVTVKYGLTQQFTAEVVRKPDAKLKWEVVAGRGGIDPDTGLFRAPAAPQPLPPAPVPVAGAAPAPVVIGPEHATVRVTCVDYATAIDLAVVTFA